MRKIKIVLSVVINATLILSGVIPVYAGGVGTTGTTFLKIGIGARPVAMGESFVAVADDVYAIHYNPAGLSQTKRIQIGLTHNVWLEKINQDFVGIVLPFGNLGSLGFSATYISMDKLEGYDVDTNYEPVKTEDFTASDLVVIFSGALALNKNLSIGTNLKAVQQKIENESALGRCLDAGILLRIEKLKLAAVIQNLGPKIKFISEEDPLPQNFKFGAAYLFGKNILTVEANKPIEKDMYFNIGEETTFFKILSLRIGYTTGKDIGPGLSGGFGVKILSLTLDYAFVPYGDLGNTHRVSFTARF